MIDDVIDEKCKNRDNLINYEHESDDSKLVEINKLECEDNATNFSQHHLHHQFQQLQRQQQQDIIENKNIIDKDGLILALRYFTSSTLTMRLAGIAQINNYISLFNEFIQNENTISNARQTEGEQFVEWVLNNKIIEHIFGPNLHVEVIKQSQIILNFVVSHLTAQHIDVIWSASQLKHCSRQVFDIIMPLIKNMNVSTVLHLYSLLKNLDVKEHTEQTLFLGSYLLKFIWSKSFNIVEPTNTNKQSNEDVTNVNSSIYTILPESVDFWKDDTEDSSASASIETSEEEEPENFLFKERKFIRLDASDSICSFSSQISHEEDTKNEESNINDLNHTEKTVNNSQIYKTSVAHQKLKLHCQSYSQQDTTSNVQSPLPLLNSEYLEKKEINDDNLCSSDSEPELSDLKNKKQYQADYYNQIMQKFGKAFDEFDKNRLVENEGGDEEDFFNSEDDQSSDIIPVIMVNKKNCNDSNIEPARSILSDSNSSQFSEKNMADFEGEDSGASGCDVEISDLNQEDSLQRQNLSFKRQTSVSPSNLSSKKSYVTHSILSLSNLQDPNIHVENMIGNKTMSISSINENNDIYENEITQELIKFSLDNVCKPGQTLLWDLLQDDSICYLSEGLSLNCEKMLYNLICWLSDKRLRMKFIEGCLDNISQNSSVIISLRLLPKLLMSFEQQRGKSEIYTITMMAERERGLLKNFFSNLILYTEKHKYFWENRDDDSINQQRSSPNTIYEQPRKIRKISDCEKLSDDGKANNRKQNKNDASISYNQTSLEFFNNMLYSHLEEIQTRLVFLSIIFSNTCSPENFQLNKEQVDILWSCIAYDVECRDELFSWLLNQVRTKDQHALSNEMLEFILIKKMPSLKPESFTMVALELLQNLSNYVFSKKQHEMNQKLTKKNYNPVEEESTSKKNISLSNESEQQNLKKLKDNNWDIASIAIKQLWDIALRAINTDVSMAAIKHLNNYYVHLQSSITLDKEEEFIKQCMDYLSSSSNNLKLEEEKNLTIIQRALILLKTHLEAFRCRYSFHLRLLQLNDDTSIISHRNKLDDRVSQQMIKLHCQFASLNEKATFELHVNDYIGELRAEISHWWIKLVNRIKSDSEIMGITNKKIVSLPIDGPLRLLSQGQEIPNDLDEKTFLEMNFKDGQIIYVSIGANRQIRRKETIEPASRLPAPPKDRLPSILLLNPIYFEQLFDLLQQMGSMRGSKNATRAQVLSRRVWKIINLLPTSPELMKNFKNILSKDQNLCSAEKSLVPIFNTLLNPNSPQKLLYSLQIVDYLQKTNNEENNSSETNIWLKKFVDCGGLKHLFDIFISGVLQLGESEVWNEWKQDCLASLLQLIYQIGINNTLDLNDTKKEDSLDSQSSSENIQNEQNLTQLQQNNSVKRKRYQRNTNEKLIVHLFNKQLLSMLTNVESVLKVILTILDETCSISVNSNVYQTGFWGRAQIVYHTFTFLTSWLYSDPSIRNCLFQFPIFDNLLKKLVLDDPDPTVRRETCSCLYRICLGNSMNRKTGTIFIPHLLNSLLTFLPNAQSMKPAKNIFEQNEYCFIDKESYGPGCKDYFWLICRLIDSLEVEAIGDSESKVDLEKLCIYLANAIEQLEIRELRHSTTEDESLRGLLCLMGAALKHNPPYKHSEKCKQFLFTIFESLFAFPNPVERNLPKCKQPSTRSAAFDLLIELIKECEENHISLMKLLYEQHTPISHNIYNWDYWPHDDCRSECGYVGLINLGATCYMASSVQHLFMFPEVRQLVLKANVANDTKNASIFYELQRMFAFLMESERKAYNPKNFCKVYTMDNQPLNTGEQKDMTEFFTDLISKLEDMSTDLKDTLRNLFAGTLSNNVVSLDCSHISRTTEEFYTLRCKVADMRNLYDSLDEITVKDTLEGDNMYTCSQCGKKVRAEKRACLKKLPEILCLNTLRYTFNMVTMTKEKVNTHFSFPMKIDMSPYLEENLIRDNETSKNEFKEEQISKSDFTKEDQSQLADKKQNLIFNKLTEEKSNEYELIGVNVHTGTADGGHYYCFIREPDSSKGKDKWYIFNDAEVHLFDPSQLASECFGGEMTSKTYDSINDKFMDFAIEKTNSAYMLFYKRMSKSDLASCSSVKTEKSIANTEFIHNLAKNNTNQSQIQQIKLQKQLLQQQKHQELIYEIPKELSNWIWEDNIQFIKDKSIFEHSYFHFMWQVCAFIPQSINNSQKIMLLSAQLATAFVVETLIHSKEKPTIANWIELLTKQFNASLEACEWLIDHIAENYLHWPVQILLKCPNQMVRQLFQRLCIHVITELKKSQQSFYLKSNTTNENEKENILQLSDKSKLISIQNEKVFASSSLNDEEKQNLTMIDNLLPDYGNCSCVTRLIRRFLLLIKCNNQIVRPHLKHLTEYFNLLYEFAKMGDIECEFLLKVEAISIIVQFYLSHCKANGEFVEMVSEDDEEESNENVEEDQQQQNQFQLTLDQLVQNNSTNQNNGSPTSASNFSVYRNGKLMGNLSQSFKEFHQDNKYLRPASLDKMISFIAFLVEKSRNSSGVLCLSANDTEALIGKNFAFFYRQIRDNINLRQTFNLICTLCINNEKLSNSVINMILNAINRQPEASQPFFIMLSMLLEISNSDQQQSTSINPINVPMTCFSSNIYPKIWEIAEQNPLQCLEWLTAQVPRNTALHNIVLQNLDNWIEYFLIGHNNQRVRHAAALLIISLVPNSLFRQSYYKSLKTLIMQTKEHLELNEEAILVVRKIFSKLLATLKIARRYIDIQTHGTSKLTSYFALMYYCLISKTEKLMLVPYFNDLWTLFQPRLSEQAVPVNQNKQSLLFFWYQACLDCSENVECIVQNSQVTKNIAFNYILADHEDQEVVLFNRIMLPSYYGLLRLCCVHSREFTRYLSMHQNILWAFKNITPYYTQYQAAINELFKLMKHFITVFPNMTEPELREIRHFKKSAILTYSSAMDPRTSWTTLISAYNILLETEEDRLFAITNNSLNILFHSFNTLFLMFYEATACHITNELVELTRLICALLSTISKNQIDHLDSQEYIQKWKDNEILKKPVYLLNTFVPPEVRLVIMNLICEISKVLVKDYFPYTVQNLGLLHLSFQEQYMHFTPGPYFPKVGQSGILMKSSIRPEKPIFQMHFHPKILQISYGKDKNYDKALNDFYFPYYKFVENMCKIGITNKMVNQELVGFCSLVALESLNMRATIFPKMWCEIAQTDNGKDFIKMLCTSNNYFRDYLTMILTQEKEFLYDDNVFEMIKICLPKVQSLITNYVFVSKIITLITYIKEKISTVNSSKKNFELLSILRAIYLVFSNEQCVSILEEEQKTILMDFRNKCMKFVYTSDTSSSEEETPQKRRKAIENESSADENENCSAKFKSVRIKVPHFNRTISKIELKNSIEKIISDLIRLLEIN